MTQRKTGNDRRRRVRGKRAQSACVTSTYKRSVELVRSAFFTFDPSELERFAEAYGRHYGQSASQYFRQTYDGWRNGTKTMAARTERRILKHVPPIMSMSKQFELLALHVPSVLEQHRRKMRARRLTSSRLLESYTAIARSIVEDNYSLDWFVREVFPEEEVEQFLNALKFVTLSAVHQSYTQVMRDLNRVQRELHEFDGCASVDYEISLLDCPVDIDVVPADYGIQLPVELPEPLFVTQFGPDYRRIVKRCVEQRRKEHAVSRIDGRVATVDIAAMRESLMRLRPDHECDCTMTVEGEGGRAVLYLARRNLTRLQGLASGEAVKLAALLAVAVGGIIWASAGGFLGGLVLPGMAWLVVIFVVWQRFLGFRAEVRDYERERTKRLAAS